MDCYCELKALPNPEIIESAVVAELMQVMHRWLPAFKGRIGLDFPLYRQPKTLGGIIRILGKKDDIVSLHTTLKTDASVQDYALLTGIKDIPTSIKGYARIQRHHAKGNSRFKRLKKRHEEKGTWSQDLEKKVLEKFSVPLTLPYLGLKSSSSGQTFLLFIERKPSKGCVPGLFNSYGLGINGATIPIL